MYEQFFHLNKRPFSIAPDPGFLYLSDRHRDALAHLKYGLETDGGFVLVTGEVGTGKTTLLRNIIGEVPGDIDVAFILNPRLTVRELLQTICDELGIDYPSEDQHSVKPYIDRLNKHLLRAHRLGRSTVVVIDEAQNLSPAVLEQLRLLTNLETNERKLLRIILVGQPELKAMLSRQELRQLSQRITARYHLEPLTLADTRAYLAHRLRVSGGNPNLFSTGASWNIHRHAGGIPRLINIIADRSMLGAYAAGTPNIDFMTAQKAARETMNQSRNLWTWLAATGVLLLAISGSWFLLDRKAPSATANTPPSAEVQQTPAEPLTQRVSRSTATPTAVEVQTPEPVEDNAAPGQNSVTPQPVNGVRSFRSQRLAFSTMYELWGIAYKPDDATVPCDYAPRYQLQCTKRVGDWEIVERLNVPVILQLRAPSNQLFYAAAVSAGNGGVLLDQGGKVTAIRLANLSSVWDGTFIALWPTPKNYRGPLQTGSSGEAVRELRKLLGDAINRNLGTSRIFDAELSAALQEFQSVNGLDRDGIAGPATWLLLHRAADYDIPELLG